MSLREVLAISAISIVGWSIGQYVGGLISAGLRAASTATVSTTTAGVPPAIDTSKGTPQFIIVDGPVANYITVATVKSGKILITLTGADGISAKVEWTKVQAADIGKWISEEAAKP